MHERGSLVRVWVGAHMHERGSLVRVWVGAHMHERGSLVRTCTRVGDGGHSSSRVGGKCGVRGGRKIAW
eukprot:360066-Chlamydomonas_euryale.AAC.5